VPPALTSYDCKRADSTNNPEKPSRTTPRHSTENTIRSSSPSISIPPAMPIIW
jgi:hypothetical protein